MEAILNFLQGIANGFVAIVNFIQNLVADLVYCFKLLGHFLVQMPEFLGFLPAAVVAIFTMTFAAALVFKVIGR